jgi:DNA gyrase subunit A
LKKDITNIIQENMGIYGTNINVARAFATYIDGLKPVHRKSLYTMNDLKMFPNSPHRKAAVVVGTALAKYYCHGDTSIYDATIFMSQDFSQRIPYVDVNGNNGAVTGDLHAHMRYVEVKLSEYGYNVFLDKEYLEWILPVSIPKSSINSVKKVIVFKYPF